MTRFIRYLVGAVLCLFMGLHGLNAQQINYAEYFFDNDPGAGNATALTLTSSNTIDQDYTISTSALSEGTHMLYVRIKDSNGKWSLAMKRLVYINVPATTSARKLNYAEYFMDNDPGFGSGTSISFTSGDTINQDFSLSTSSFSPGMHHFFVRVRDNQGLWSLNHSKLLHLLQIPVNQQIVSAEYFFNADPGLGSATSISITAGDTINEWLTIPVGSLDHGFNQLYVRIKNASGIWSMVEQQILFKSKGLNNGNITHAEYFFDDDPGFNQGTAITVTAGDTVNIIANLNTSGLSPGVHQFCVRVKDVNGLWSLLEQQMVYVLPGNQSSPKIIAAEYFFDDDPGFGGGTAFNFTPNTVIDISKAIASSNLSMGMHNLHIRVQDSVGQWSLHTSDVVYVRPSQASQKIVAIEYSVDTIMSHGQGDYVSFAGVDSLDYTFNFNHGITDTFYHALYVRVKDAGGRWSFVDSMNFRLENCIIPTAVFNFNDFCIGDSITLFNSSLDTDTGTVYAWDVGNDGFVESNDSTSYIFKPTAPGKYKINLKVTNFVCIDTAMASIRVFPKPDNSISVFGSTSICPGGFSVLSANSGVGFQYQWLKNGNLIANAASNFYQASDSGLYRAVIENIYNCTDTTSSVSISMYDLPAASMTVNGSNSLCYGDSVLLSTVQQAGLDYQWYYNGDTLAGAHTHELWAKNAGDYKIKITNNDGCSDISSNQTIVVNPKPNATIQASGASTLCSGENLVLYGSNGIGFTYQWIKDGNALGSETSSFLNVNQSGDYRVKITNAFQCVDTSVASTITVNPSPISTIQVTGQLVNCQGDSVKLSGPSDPGLSYQWNSYGTALMGETDSVLTVVQTGNYSLITTNTYNCSTESQGTVVTVNPVPGASILPLGPTSFCQGDSVVLQANAGLGLSYEWMENGAMLSGNTNNQLLVDSSGVFTVKVTNTYNCSSESQAINVTSFPIPTADFNVPSVNCSSDTVTVQYQGTASSSAFYNWNFDGGVVLSGNGQGPYEVIWSQSGSKTLSLSVSENACISNQEVQSMQMLSVPSFITAPLTAACQGDSLILTANSGANYGYLWYQGGVALSGDTLNTLNVTSTGNYRVKVTDNNNSCYRLSAAVPVSIHTTDFNLDFAASTTTFSQPPFNVTINNQTPNLNEYNFLWELGDGSTSTFFNPIHSYQYNGDYTVSLFAEHATTGCRDTLIKQDYISCSGGAPNPCNILAAITPAGPVTVCGGDSVLLTASAGTGYTYQWVFNNMVINGAVNQTIYAKQSGNYRVIISDSLCSQTSPAFVLNNYPSIQPVIQAAGQIQPCTFDSLQLSLFVNYNSYNWSTGDSTPTVWVTQTGYYQVAVTDNFGCNLTSQPFVVNNSFLNPPEICIVGVDSNNHNRMVWERQSNALIDSFYVYRESFIAGQYVKIGALPFSQSSLFVDTNSNPAIQSYRYKIAAVDTCGGVTLLSDFHKTIHLTINAGLNGSWNLIWDGYQGFPFSTYRIYRGTNASNMSLLTQLPSTATSYTDLNPPGGVVYYQIEVIKSSGCYPDTVNSKANTNYNTSRSNTANNGSIAPVFLTADFNADVVSGQWPIQVSFSDVSTGNPNQWEWDFGDGNSSILQNPKHTYNNTGLYTVKLKVCNGTTCDTTTKVGYINVLPNGMVEVGVELAAKLFPNPNDGSFTLEIFDQSSHRMEVHIYGATGQEVYREVFQSQGKTSKDIQLNHLPKGVYYLHLNTNESIIYREKVVIQ
jgi:PKD repeat protein